MSLPGLLAEIRACRACAEDLKMTNLLGIDSNRIIALTFVIGAALAAVAAVVVTARREAELSALVQENCFYDLEAPIERVTGWDTPYPHAFEWEYFPGPKRVGDAYRQTLTGGRG